MLKKVNLINRNSIPIDDETEFYQCDFGPRVWGCTKSNVSRAEIEKNRAFFNDVVNRILQNNGCDYSTNITLPEIYAESDEPVFIYFERLKEILKEKGLDLGKLADECLLKMPKGCDKYKTAHNIAEYLHITFEELTNVKEEVLQEYA